MMDARAMAGDHCVPSTLVVTRLIPQYSFSRYTYTLCLRVDKLFYLRLIQATTKYTLRYFS